MLKKILAIIMTAMLLSASFGLEPAHAQTGAGASNVEVEKARAGISKAGVGEKARVEVTLRDNTRLKGYVSEAGENSFTLTDAKTGASNRVAYADVASVSKKGGGLSTSTKAIIAGASVAAAAIVLYTVRGAFCDGMC